MGALVQDGEASPLRVATGGDANLGSKAIAAAHLAIPNGARRR
jgi:hypothetical protein